MTPEVERAIGQIQQALPDHEVEVIEEQQGGAYVIVSGIDIGPVFNLSKVWCGFLITFQYPSADVYPHYLGPVFTRVDGQALGESFSGPTEWLNRSCIQVSRRSNHLDPSIDTAATKLLKIISWVRSR